MRVYKYILVLPLVCIVCSLVCLVSGKESGLRRRTRRQENPSLVDWNEFVVIDSLFQEDDNEARFLQVESMSIDVGKSTSQEVPSETLVLDHDLIVCVTEDESKALGNACSRITTAKATSTAILDRNYQYVTPTAHITNGDEVKYGADSQIPFIGSFHKTLPHYSNGTVHVQAYQFFVEECIAKQNVSACSNIPGTGMLANPLGGYYVPPSGIPPFAFVIPPPPSVDSAELANMYAEVAWMALVRDVPFSQYNTNAKVQEAAENLSKMASHTDIDNVKWKRPIGPEGQIDAATQLFRLDFQGITEGPMVSQLLFEFFTVDGIVVEPKITTIVPEVDTMTTWTEFLCVQNGRLDCMEAPPKDSIPRYIRNARDLGFVSQHDVVTSIYTRAAKIQGLLQPQISFYGRENRHDGFVTQGLARIHEQIVAVAAGVSPAWFSKFNVHRAIRPEAYGGLVQQTLNGTIFPIHESLLNNVVLEKMVDKWGSTLLPQINDRGCPNHPSYPAGHAMIAGACVTVLKVYMDPDGTRCYPNPIKQASVDGLTLNIIRDENTGPNCLTVHGELQKLAHNLSLGRDMSGLHFRSDAVSGILQGEEYAITYLQDQLDRQPECATLKFKSFHGEIITLSPRGDQCR